MVQPAATRARRMFSSSMKRILALALQHADLVAEVGPRVVLIHAELSRDGSNVIGACKDTKIACIRTRGAAVTGFPRVVVRSLAVHFCQLVPALYHHMQEPTWPSNQASGGPPLNEWSRAAGAGPRAGSEAHAQAGYPTDSRSRSDSSGQRGTRSRGGPAPRTESSRSAARSRRAGSVATAAGCETKGACWGSRPHRR